MNSCERTILALLSRALFGREGKIEAEIDFKALYDEARIQTVHSLVYSALTEGERAQMSPLAVDKWEQLVFSSAIMNEQVLYEQRRIVDLLDKNCINCVILKGVGSALNYPEPSLRVLGDIDLLVATRDIDTAARLLTADGYEQEKDGELHLSFHKNNVVVELHKKPISLSFNENEDIAAASDAFFADIIEKRQLADGIPLPSFEHQAIILLLHKLAHFLNGELGLRQLCDWAVFVKERVDAKLWQVLLPTLDKLGIKTFTLVVTRACIDHLGLPRECAEWAMECDEELAGDVVELVVESGNFGTKVANSYGQRLFVDAHSGNRISSFFKVLWSTCRSHWPICEKHPILMPIAPFVVYFRYLKMRKRGERKRLHLGAIYQRAGTRQKLYQEIQPFITMGDKSE